MTVSEAAAAARDNLCAMTLVDLADACRVVAREGASSPMPALALHSIFRGLYMRLDDRPVATSEVDKLRKQLGPLLDLLTSRPDEVSTEELDQAIDALPRDLF